MLQIFCNFYTIYRFYFGFICVSECVCVCLSLRQNKRLAWMTSRLTDWLSMYLLMIAAAVVLLPLLLLVVVSQAYHIQNIKELVAVAVLSFFFIFVCFCCSYSLYYCVLLCMFCVTFFKLKTCVASFACSSSCLSALVRVFYLLLLQLVTT